MTPTSPYIKISVKRTEDLFVEGKTLKLGDDNIDLYHHVRVRDRERLNRYKSTNDKGKLLNWIIKAKKFYSSKDASKKMKRASYGVGKYICNSSDEQFI